MGVGKILLLSFKDDEEEILNSVLSVLETGRNIYCSEGVIQSSRIQQGDITILLDRREVFRKQKKINISFTEFEILQLLARNPGRVFSKDSIYDLVWKEPYSGNCASDNVMNHISHIRKKIEDDPGNPVYIQTIWNVGYRFNPNLSVKP